MLSYTWLNHFIINHFIVKQQFGLETFKKYSTMRNRSLNLRSSPESKYCLKRPPEGTFAMTNTLLMAYSTSTQRQSAQEDRNHAADQLLGDSNISGSQNTFLWSPRCPRQQAVDKQDNAILANRKTPLGRRYDHALSSTAC